MGLSANNCAVRTIVDWTWDKSSEDDVRRLRDPRKRGIIVKVEGEGTDKITGVWVKFGINEEPVKVPPKELVRVFSHESSTAKEAYRRVMGNAKNVGAEFGNQPRRRKPKVHDALALTPRMTPGVVKPPEDERQDEGAGVAGMELPDSGA